MATRRRDGVGQRLEILAIGLGQFVDTQIMAAHAAAGFGLALVSAHPDGPKRDEVRYIVDPFRDVDFGDFAATGIIGDWDKEWAREGAPV